MFRILSYLLLAGAAAYASQPPATTATSTTETRTCLLPAGTTIPVRLDQSLDTKRDPVGSRFVATVSAPVVRGGEVIVPRGARAHGHVFESKPSGRLKGRAVLGLTLDSVEFRGRVYHVHASGPVFVSRNHKKHDALWIGGGAGTGATIGAIAGGGVGAAVGAGAGAVVGTAGAAITGKKQVHVAAETRMVFTMRRPAAL
jgi:hypothetical protein